MRNDTNWIVAGAVAAVLLPALAAVGIPFLVALGVAAVAFIGLVVLLSPRKLFEEEKYAGIDKHKLALARTLLTEAMPAAQRLDAASDRIGDPLTRQKVNALARIAHDIFDRLEADPQKADAARRFLTYYLPQAAEVAEGYAVIETKRTQDPKRLEDVAAVIDKLEDAFVHFADGLAEADLRSLDTDLKQIEHSLKKDIGR